MKNGGSFHRFLVCLPQGNPNISRVLSRSQLGSQLDFQGPGTTTSGAIPTASRIPNGERMRGTAWDGALGMGPWGWMKRM